MPAGIFFSLPRRNGIGRKNDKNLQSYIGFKSIYMMLIVYLKQNDKLHSNDIRCNDTTSEYLSIYGALTGRNA